MCARSFLKNISEKMMSTRITMIQRHNWKLNSNKVNFLNRPKEEGQFLVDLVLILKGYLKGPQRSPTCEPKEEPIEEEALTAHKEAS